MEALICIAAEACPKRSGCLFLTVFIIYHAHTLQPFVEVVLAFDGQAAAGLLLLDLFVFYVVAGPYFLVHRLIVLFYSSLRLEFLLNHSSRLDDRLNGLSNLTNPFVQLILIFEFFELLLIFGGQAFVVFLVL